jgi:hypothetical protein
MQKNKGGNEMKNETIRNQNVQRDATLMCDRLSELCSGSPENEFDVYRGHNGKQEAT